jgi:hypothetical protein
MSNPAAASGRHVKKLRITTPDGGKPRRAADSQNNAAILRRDNEQKLHTPKSLFRATKTQRMAR